MALDLYDILETAGVTQLRDSGKEVRGACPMHYERTGRMDRHPSWSINKNKLTHNCFSCHYAGSLSQLLTDLGHPPSSNLEQELKQESFLRKMAEVNPTSKVEESSPILTEWSLHNLLGDVPQRLVDLKMLKRFALDHYEVRWDKEYKCWVLPLRDPTGALLGAQYRKKGFVRTDPEGLAKSELMFGYSQVRDYDHVVVTESPLDAVRLYGLGIPAVAALGSWVSDAQARMLSRSYSRVYLALDNDKAGREGSERLFPTIRKLGASPVMWNYTNTDVKDLGDVEDDEEVLAMWNATLSFGLARV